MVINTPKTTYDKILRYARRLGFGDLHFKLDPLTQLQAVVAIHSTQRGSAIGGCRLLPYPSTETAIVDALRLAYMMSFKAAASQLPHGGAKAVIIKPPQPFDREALFSRFGDFVQELGGRYVTAVDSGTEITDMDIIARRTRFVTSTTLLYGISDPSVYTAHGVCRGIAAAVKFKLGRDELAGLHIAIQGAGHVGYYLAKQLKTLGARISMSDVDPAKLQRCVTELQVTPVAPEAIYSLKCDVFAPCALGGILNLATIQQLQTSIVAGAANSQLAHRQHGMLLHERGIIYAPDFMINAGGLIRVASLYDHGDEQQANLQIDAIYDRLLTLFIRAARENQPCSTIAEIIALENMGKC